MIRANGMIMKRLGFDSTMDGESTSRKPHIGLPDIMMKLTSIAQVLTNTRVLIQGHKRDETLITVKKGLVQFLCIRLAFEGSVRIGRIPRKHLRCRPRSLGPWQAMVPTGQCNDFHDDSTADWGIRRLSHFEASTNP